MYTDHMFQNKENKSVPEFSRSSLVSERPIFFEGISEREPGSSRRRTACAKWAPGKMLKSYERSAPTLASAVTDRLVRSACLKCELNHPGRARHFHNGS
jgi:hypothetical protein